MLGRSLRIVVLFGLLVTLVGVPAMGRVEAQDEPPSGEPPPTTAAWDGTQPEPLTNEGGIYFPWVANDFEPANPEEEDATGLGQADTAVTVQNLTDERALVFAFVGLGEGGLTDKTGEIDADDEPNSDDETNGWDIVGPFLLSAGASKTFLPEDLGILPGDGAPVNFSSFHKLQTAGGTPVCTTTIGAPLAPGVDVNGNGTCTDVESTASVDVGANQFRSVCVVNDRYGNPAPVLDTVGRVFEWHNIETIEDLARGNIEIDGLNADGDCRDEELPLIEGEGEVIAEPAPIAGFAKQAVGGENLPFTSSIDQTRGELIADSAVSGYNAVAGLEIVEYDDWYLPIVQRNGGPGGQWNTIIRIANFGQKVGSLKEEERQLLAREIDSDIDVLGQAAVTIRFFPADDAAGSHNTGFQLEQLLNAGEVWHINAARYLPPGWIGSAHIYSDGAIFALADRIKPGFGQWLTNTASNASHTVEANSPNPLGNYVLYAPDVRNGYYGWNTGINVANLADEDNTITVQYLNASGSAPVAQTRRLAPQGMTYIYDPSEQSQAAASEEPGDPDGESLGAALIWSEYPVAVAIDATKYPPGATVGDASDVQSLTYSATANLFNQQAFPLVQKGSSADGSGPISGINVMNPHDQTAEVTLRWVNQSGYPASDYGPTTLVIPAHANGFIYTMHSANLPNGFYGSAVLTSTLPVAAVTTQADYQVISDGSAVWNGHNPCGYYRDAGNPCTIVPPPDVVPDVSQVTVQLIDQEQLPIPGIVLRLNNLATPLEFTGSTDEAGQVAWANVPAGNYTLTVVSVPMDGERPLYDCPVAKTAEVPAGQELTMTIECAPGPIDPNAPGMMNIAFDKETVDILPWQGVEITVQYAPADAGDIGTDDPSGIQKCINNSAMSDFEAKFDEANGDIRHELPPGEYCVIVRWPPGSAYFASPVTIDPDDPVDDIDVTVK